MRAAAFNARRLERRLSRRPHSSGRLNGSERVNVLMVGYGGPDHDGAYLADSIQILSIDPDDRHDRPRSRSRATCGSRASPRSRRTARSTRSSRRATSTATSRSTRAGDLMADVLSDGHRPRDRSLAVDRLHRLPRHGRRGRRRDDRQPGRLQLHDERAARTAPATGTRAASTAGEIHLDGAQALAYSRARYTSVVAGVDRLRAIGPPGPGPRRAALELGDGGLGAILPGPAA